MQDINLADKVALLSEFGVICNRHNFNIKDKNLQLALIQYLNTTISNFRLITHLAEKTTSYDLCSNIIVIFTYIPEILSMYLEEPEI